MHLIFYISLSQLEFRDTNEERFYASASDCFGF